VNTALSALAIVGGFVVLAATAMSVVRTLVVPRGLVSRVTFSADRLLRSAFRSTARLARGYAAKDRILSYEGPMRLFGYLVVWLILALLGYALVYWPFVGSFPGGLAIAIAFVTCSWASFDSLNCCSVKPAGCWPRC